MTAEVLTAAGIPVNNEVQELLRAEAALDWMQTNTTLVFDKADATTIAALPASAKLFIVKFSETMKRETGLVSQSIEGLSMGFSVDGSGFTNTIWQLANALLNGFLKSQVRVFPAKQRW